MIRAAALLLSSIAFALGLVAILRTVDHLHVELGDLSGWVVALATFVASVVALSIASRDRRERRRERQAQQLAEATLVLVRIEVPAYRAFDVVVGNYGSRPVIDVTLESADFASYPEADVDWAEVDPHVQILKCNEVHSFPIEFVDEHGQNVFEITKDSHGNEQYQDRESADSVSVRFMDADGISWRRLTSGEVIRIGPKLPNGGKRGSARHPKG